MFGDKSNSYYKNGSLQAPCKNSDPSSALIECSGSFLLHFAFYLMIQYAVEKTSDEVFCYKRVQDDAKWKGINDKASWIRTNDPNDISAGSINTDAKSFINKSIDELKYAHITCALLLFMSKVFLFKNIGRFSLGMQGVMRLATIPLYLFVLYRAEFAIRRFRPSYTKESTATEFNLVTTMNYNVKGGSFCLHANEGNAY